ncbi:MAG: tetratricopeptide repeat protein [Alphaproteobacteria bacterium]|nr:tetratricopeptide repeat protein [Alphaproteobacteria bacterium]
MLARPVRLRSLLSILLVCAAWPAVAGPLEDGLAAYKAEDFDAALRLLRPLAEQGEAPAQWGLGAMYSSGQGVLFNPEAAVSWFRKAADQGHANSEFGLGVIYENGFGVQQSNTEAMSWYRKAVDHGHAAAAYNLGVMYDDGIGIARDQVQAHLWLSLAVARLDAAQEGMMHEIAAETLRRISAKMTPAQLAESARLANEWKPQP